MKQEPVGNPENKTNNIFICYLENLQIRDRINEGVCPSVASGDDSLETGSVISVHDVHKNLAKNILLT